MFVCLGNFWCCLFWCRLLTKSKIWLNLRPHTQQSADQYELQCKSVKLKTCCTTLPQYTMLYLSIRQEWPRMFGEFSAFTWCIRSAVPPFHPLSSFFASFSPCLVLLSLLSFPPARLIFLPFSQPFHLEQPAACSPQILPLAAHPLCVREECKW